VTARTIIIAPAAGGQPASISDATGEKYVREQDREVQQRIPTAFGQERDGPTRSGRSRSGCNYRGRNGSALAESFLAELLGDGLFRVIRERGRRSRRWLRAGVTWLADAAKPPPLLELTSSDGATFTGFALLERSRPVLLLAIRHNPRADPRVTPPSPMPPRHPFGVERSYLDPDGPGWDHEHPYGR